ncbi:MAG: hypothetical protein A2X86_00030 [Bdellovibrionales bacterium GWA2_49_15]|nr:MAG: hypothetical protein A2X86_00030 [Bdellovibrionales bacterium GWA2_49_15]HAZ14429.1 hypothetical protein [Bdellovibrionales bacterium]
MALKLINSESVRQDLRGLTLWFSEDERNLLVVHDAHGIIFFEYIDSNKVVEGGRGLKLKAGDIGSSRTPMSYLRRSRVIAYNSTAEADLRNDLKKEIENCSDMPPYLQQAFKSYLGGKSQSLEFTTALKDYRPRHNSNPLFRAMAPLYRYRTFQLLNGWFLPVIIGAGIGLLGFQFIYQYSQRYDPVRACFKMGHFNDCAETLRRAMVSQEKEQVWPENALQNVLLACKDGSQPDACGLIHDFIKIKPNEEWVKKFIATDCRPQSLSNVCSLLGRILVAGGKSEEAMLAQVLQCQYLRSVVADKLAVEILTLNLLHDLRECRPAVILDVKGLSERLCREGQICAPLVAKTFASTVPKKVLGLLEKSCQQYHDDQCILLACLQPTAGNLQFFRSKAVLFWKDGGGEKTIVRKAIPQFYHTLTTGEQIQARQAWERECTAGDLRSCFGHTATSEEKDFDRNVKKFCALLPGYFKKASLTDLLTLRLSLKLSGE